MKLVVDTVTVERGGRAIVAGLSFVVGTGEALMLTGRNGAGKTTLLRAIAGLLAPAAGTIRLEGGDVEQSIAEQCHFVGHQNGIKSQLTVAENLTFWACYLGSDAAIPSRDRVDAALRHFDLAPLAAIPAGYLSAGQKRRLGLARLLTANRPLWVLDEPSVSLDSGSSGLLATAIGTHVAAGGLAIAATHLPLGLERPRELNLSADVTTAPQGRAS